MSTQSNGTQSSGQEKGRKQAPVLEMVLFRLQPGVSSETFLALSDEIQQWLEQQPGYLHREVFMAEDGQWLDLVGWAGMAEAVGAAERFFAQPFVAGFDRIFAPGANSQHLYQVRAYETVRV